ncbi:MAG: hypothetical protein F4Z04_14540 [Acidobacteria bacterium]|nr:hypothetical protein [Acidobacteriota bacterium]
MLDPTKLAVMPARGPYTRTGIRRSGDSYQDAVALDVLVDWLANPNAVEYVRVEADDAGALDDVVILTPDSVVAIQVKFSGYPEHEGSSWSLQSLLSAGTASPTGQRTHSLLTKWLLSVDKLRKFHPGRTIDARVLTNRSAASDLARALTDGATLDLGQVEDGAIRSQLIQLLEDLQADPTVLSHLRFQFNHPSLEGLEDTAWHKFRQLGFDDHGWLTLNHRLRKWIRHRYEPPPDGRILLPALREACNWNELQGLYQEFPIPTDYVSPSAEFDSDIRKTINSGEPCQVIVASPGLGKSTYISALYQRLTEDGVPVVRHHYFLSQTERAGRRVGYKEAAESLLHDIRRDHHGALGTTATHQPSHTDLQPTLQQCGAFYLGQGRRFVVLLDGLDHVWRQKNSAEDLAQLLDEFFPLPAGVALVVATQPVAREQLPPSLLQAVPRNRWKELPHLDRKATTEWVKQHGIELGLPDVGHHAALERLAHAFFNISRGNPLHLKYSLSALLQGSEEISEQSVSSLPPCPTDEITSYYERLVEGLDEAGRLVLTLIAYSDFPWPQGGLVDCLGELGIDLVTADRGLTQLSHLLQPTSLGLRPFHSSLLAFVRSTPHYMTSQETLCRAVVRWLEHKAPTYWRWAYEWRLRADLGEEQPLRDGPDREWIIEAVAIRRPISTTESLLARSSALALTPQHLPTALERSVSCDYLNDVYHLQRETAEAALFAQLVLQEDDSLLDWLSEDVAQLSASEVHLLAERADALNRVDDVERCYQELRRRVNNREFDNPGGSPSPTDTLGPLYRVAAIAQRADTAVSFALAHGAEGGLLVRHMVRELRIRRDAAGLRTALQLTQDSIPNSAATTPNNARHKVTVEIINGLTLLALEESLDVDDIFFGREELEALPSARLYLTCRRGRATAPVELPVFELPDTRYLLPEQRQHLCETIRYVILGLLANHCSGHDRTNRQWLRDLHCSDWVRNWFERLDTGLSACADDVRSGAGMTPSQLLAPFDDLELPHWLTGATELSMDFGRVASDSLCTFSFESLTLSGHGQTDPRLSQTELQEWWSSPFIGPRRWVENAVAWRRELLDDDALQWALVTRRTTLDRVDEAFYERADQFGWLAGLAAMHGCRVEATELLRKYAANQLSHGYHKDMCLSNALSAIQSLAEDAPMDECRSWLKHLAKPIAAVGRFTDGDETSYLPARLGRALCEVAPDCLGAYYRFLVDREEYEDADSVFEELLRIIDLSTSEARAIALTAITPTHREILEQRGSSGDPFARAVVDELERFLGRPSGPTDQRDESEDTIEPPRVDPTVRAADYDLSCFEDYRHALVASGDFELCAGISTWLDHWRAQGKGAEALQAVVETRVKGYGIENLLWREFRDQQGREAAFPWLVEAQKGLGWSEWFSSRTDAEERWQAVADDYPEKWFEFLRNSLVQPDREEVPEARVSHWAWPRIIAFLLRQGQRELAEHSVRIMVKTTLDLVSAGDLGTEPSWVDDCGTHRPM